MKRFYADVGSRDSALEQRPEILKAIGMHAAIYILSRMVNNLMCIVTGQSFIRHQGIGIERSASGDVLAYFILQYLSATARNDASANLTAALQDAYDSGFVFSTSSGDTALAFANVHVPRFATDESLVYLDFSAQLRSEEIILHRKPDTVQHEPCRLLGNFHVTRNLVTADPVFAVGDKPSSGHPFVQRDRGIFHDGPDLNGEFAFRVMAGASPSPSLLAEFDLHRTASGASHNAIRPAPDSEIVNAVIGIREVDDCFLQTLWFAHGLALHEQNYSLKPWSSQLYYCPYLAELLLDKEYEVHGIIRRASTFNTARIDHIYEEPHGNQRRLYLHYGDLSTGEQLSNLIYNMQPDEIYHLGAQSHVRVSFDAPEYTGDITALGTTRILEAVRNSGIRCRFYQAGSSEMFGSAPPPQNEDTAFHPRSPYGAAKAYGHWMTVNYREAYGMFAANGILFNHESPRRGETFVTRKITRAVARIQAGRQAKLYLGRLDARRDWGYAPEYVEGMWRILQQETPSDYVLATGESHTIREFLDEAFGYLNLDWKDYVELDPRYLRPSEVDYLLGDVTRASKELGWEPKIKFKELVRIMVDADVEAIGVTPKGAGRRILEERFGEWHQWAGSVSKCLEAVAGSALGD